jgi:hypothetical protein
MVAKPNSETTIVKGSRTQIYRSSPSPMKILTLKAEYEWRKIQTKINRSPVTALQR